MSQSNIKILLVTIYATVIISMCLDVRSASCVPRCARPVVSTAGGFSDFRHALWHDHCYGPGMQP